MVVGGMDTKYSYLDDVELYAPGLPCHQKKMPHYPFKVVGATGNLAGSGKIVMCGGAKQTYSGCSGSDKRTCERNTECVTLKGGTEWCFGPKTKDCYTYELIFYNLILSGRFV